MLLVMIPHDHFFERKGKNLPSGWRVCLVSASARDEAVVPSQPNPAEGPEDGRPPLHGG